MSNYAIQWHANAIGDFRVAPSLVFNPLSPNIHIQILQTDLHTFPSRMS